jgi:Lrp/AsnC family leucine-responsive transcriptional regulator
MSEFKIDRTDQRILRELQRDARLSTTELAERVSLTPSPCWRRLKALEAEGYIRGYRTVIDPRKLGYGVTAFVSILMESHSRELGVAFEKAVQDIPEILSCHNVSGHFDFLLQVIAKDLESFGDFARENIRCLPGVKEMNSSFSLKEVKLSREIPLPD